MEADGFALPVVEAHCAYRQSARYDDELDIRTRGLLLSPVRVQFDYRGRARRGRGRSLADGPHGPRVARSATGGRAGCRARPQTCFLEANEGTRHRRRRLHRIDARRAARSRGRRRRRHRLLHRLLPARDQGTQPGRPAHRSRLPLRREPRFRTPICARCSPTGRTCSTSRRRPACARAGDAISTSIPRTTSRRRRCCSRPVSARRSSGSCTPRARRCTATTSRCRCARTRCRSRCRPTA